MRLLANFENVFENFPIFQPDEACPMVTEIAVKNTSFYLPPCMSPLETQLIIALCFHASRFLICKFINILRLLCVFALRSNMHTDGSSRSGLLGYGTIINLRFSIQDA